MVAPEFQLLTRPAYNQIGFTISLWLEKMNVASFCIYRRYTPNYVSNAHVGLKDSAVHDFHSGLPDWDVRTIPIENAEFDCKGDGGITELASKRNSYSKFWGFEYCTRTEACTVHIYNWSFFWCKKSDVKNLMAAPLNGRWQWLDIGT